MEPRPNPADPTARDAFLLRVRRLAMIPAGALLLFVALANCGQAFFFPLELELREGTGWLYVLAGRAGISIYDHGQVAFLNMNHGPLDPLLKHLLATVLPFLSAAMVTRFFVLLLPLGLWLALVRACRQRKGAALLWGLGLYLFLLGLQPPNFLVGRSDPTALFLLALLLWTAGSSLHEVTGSPRRRLLGAGLTGLIGALVLLTNWRFAPAVGAVIGAFALERLLAAAPGARWPAFGLHVAGIVAVGGATFLAILLMVFHGDWTLYYRHFFGFFSADSGWGALRTGDFQLLPPALVGAHWPIHLLALGCAALGVAFPSAQAPRRVQLWAWLPLLGLLWLTCCAAYFLNRSGGGLWYFGAFYVLLAFHLARAVGWDQPALRGLRELVLLALFCALPWRATWQQAEQLTDSFAPAQAFLHATRELAGGARIHSEDYYFFKDRYEGEVIDMGDVLFKVSATGYYGPELTATTQRYFARLRSEPPRFVISGGSISPVLAELLAQRYRPVLRIPPAAAQYAGPAQTFYQLQPAAP
ncbi:MAG TPA: hypothetical protein VG734_18665 [Lacunisphaera sp.]|nr:hypothetical protein [Lacunisphaera sp.]